MTNVVCGLEGSTHHNTCDHEHVVDFRDIHLTLMIDGSVHHPNPWKTT